MNTRMELWREYRNQIERNSELHISVKKSNDKLKILSGRLKNVYPDFFDKYKEDFKKIEAPISRVEDKFVISNKDVEEILLEIDKLENDTGSSLASFDNIDFHNEELKTIIDEMTSKQFNTDEYIEMNEKEMTMTETKEFKLNKEKNTLRIAIDGPSGSGKSTVAKMIAKKYGLKYINTGLVYRAIALLAHANKVNIKDEAKIKELLLTASISLLNNEIVMINDKEFSSELREDKISQSASIVASYIPVRNYAAKMQMSEAKRKGIIMDGRDTTFKIMPNADVKIFLDTSPEVRAQRRLKQNKELGYSNDYEEILREIKLRDKRDRERKLDPLHVTEGAHLIDASEMSLDEVVNVINKIVEKI
ncbi:MAG: (d)CMP kinase [Mycoplasmataceae bacterium]|nr:(d)CMP kinase [Mycoplasmataceae bacterium]